MNDCKEKLANPLISVIVPVYNAEKYLEKCLESIINQTYKNLEILLIDDGSTDSSGKICDLYRSKDLRIKVFHVKNGGQATARNIGLKNANGEYITFVDDDDWIEPYMYERLLTEAVQENTDITGCATLTELPDGSKKNNFQDRKSGFISGKQCNLDILYQTHHAWGAMWNKIYRRKLFQNNSFPDGMQYEDYILVTKLYTTANCIYFDAQPMYHWYMRGSSQSHKPFSLQKLSIIKGAEIIRDYFFTVKDDDLIAAANHLVFRSFADVLYSCLRSDSSQKKEVIQKYKKDGWKAFRQYLKTSKKQKNDWKLVVKFLMAVGIG